MALSGTAECIEIVNPALLSGGEFIDNLMCFNC
jgi:hypothetical protein